MGAGIEGEGSGQHKHAGSKQSEVGDSRWLPHGPTLPRSRADDARENLEIGSRGSHLGFLGFLGAAARVDGHAAVNADQVAGRTVESAPVDFTRPAFRPFRFGLLVGLS